MKTWRTPSLLTCLFLSVGLAHNASAQEDGNDYNNHKTSGPVVILPAPEVYANENGQSMPPALHLPGSEFKSGSGWFALDCTDTCKIIAETLTVTPKLHPQYDGPMVAGQLLQWQPVPPTNTLLMFKPFRAPADKLNLVAGPVKTYYPQAGVNVTRTKTPGTMECQLNLPDGSNAQLIPIMITPKKNKDASQTDGTENALSLELRIGEQRQILGQFSFGIEGSFSMKPENYLIWAGDLDGDGKLDVIIKTDFQGTDMKMFLSSLAKPGELVGEAGRFVYFPIDSPGC
jgi:hypothetical protein